MGENSREELEGSGGCKKWWVGWKGCGSMGKGEGVEQLSILCVADHWAEPTGQSSCLDEASMVPAQRSVEVSGELGAKGEHEGLMEWSVRSCRGET